MSSTLYRLLLPVRAPGVSVDAVNVSLISTDQREVIRSRSLPKESGLWIALVAAATGLPEEITRMLSGRDIRALARIVSDVEANARFEP